MSSKGVVKFNIGGTRYEVARSLLEGHPDTMVARMASEDWQQNAEAEIFIERDGTRFKYFLDYLRDGKVSLPLSVSKAAMLEDMKYYGVDPEDRVIYENIVMPDVNSIFLDSMKMSEKRHQQFIEDENNLAQEIQTTEDNLKALIQTTEDNLKALKVRKGDASNRIAVFRGARVIYEKVLSEVVKCKSLPEFPSTLSFTRGSQCHQILYSIRETDGNFDLLKTDLIDCFGIELICLRDENGTERNNIYYAQSGGIVIEFIVKHGAVRNEE